MVEWIYFLTLFIVSPIRKRGETNPEAKAGAAEYDNLRGLFAMALSYRAPGPQKKKESGGFQKSDLLFGD